MSVCILQNLEKYTVLWTDFSASSREIDPFSVSKIGPEPAKPTISLALEWTQVCGRNGYFQCSKGIAPKVCNPEIRFLCSALCLKVFNICVKFHENISNSFEVTEPTQVCGKNCHFSLFKRQ